MWLRLLSDLHPDLEGHETRIDHIEVVGDPLEPAAGPWGCLGLGVLAGVEDDVVAEK